jgi:ATP-dependent exoDNAse (exonuclease V) beta subunit
MTRPVKKGNDTFKSKGKVDGEESNIYYVAVTRSKNRLVFVSKMD